MPNNSALGGYLVPAAAAPPDADLEAVFQKLIAGVSGLPGSLVRPRWQPIPPQQPEASVNWASVGITGRTPDAGPYIVHGTGDGITSSAAGSDTLQRHETLDILVSFYGPSGAALAEQTLDGLWIAQNSEALAAADLKFTGVTGQILAVPELVNQVFIRRYDFTAKFRRKVTRVYPVLNLLSASIVLDTVDPFNQQTIAVSNPNP